MSCVIFGAGKIARGFIGHLLYLSDIPFIFVEKADVLASLRRRRLAFVNAMPYLTSLAAAAPRGITLTSSAIARMRLKIRFEIFIRYPPSYGTYLPARARSSQTQPKSRAVYRPSFSPFLTIRSRLLAAGSVSWS